MPVHLCTSISPCFLSTNTAPLQPQELTDILEISNMVFTSLFSLEMLLKLLALGLFGYIKNPYNGFDSVIVIIRWGELSVCVFTTKREFLSLVIPPVLTSRALQLNLPNCQRCRCWQLSQAVALIVQRACIHSIM